MQHHNPFLTSKPLLAIAGIGLILSYFYLDRPLTDWAAHLPNWITRSAKISSWSIDPSVYTIGLPLIFYIYIFWLRKSTFRKELLFILVAIPLSILAIDILKLIFRRARPELWLNQDIYGLWHWGWGKNWLSFPSGHAATIGGLMGALSCIRPKLTPLFLTIAISLSFLRVLSLDHYFSDIWAGTFLAFYLTWSLYNSSSKLKVFADR